MDYYEALLRGLKRQIDTEVAERLNVDDLEDLDNIPKKMLTAEQKNSKTVI